MGKRTCAVCGCDRAHFGLGYCKRHYHRLKVHGDPLGGRASPGCHFSCKIGGCGHPVEARGLCAAHYHRLLRYGSALRGGPARPRKGSPIAYLLENMRRGCSWPWPFATCTTPSGNQYGQLKIDGERWLAHRYSCRVAHGEPPTPDHEVAHNCGKSLCFNADCLRWALHVENEADKEEHGTVVWGEAHGMVRLTADTVRQIRKSEGSYTEIGRRFGISTVHARHIILRKAWRRLD